MSVDLSSLSLVKRDRIVSGGAQKTARSFWDFTIDGVSLYECVAQQTDLVSTLWIDSLVPEEEARAVRRILKLDSGDLPGDRVSLFICPECGDLGCGAITAEIVVTENEVIWRDFGYENNYEDTVRRDPYTSVGPFRFNRAAYESMFSSF